LREHRLPTTRKMQWVYNAIWASHFWELVKCDPTLPVFDGIVASLLALASGGRLDKRVHPTTAALLLQIALGGVLVFRDKARALANAMEVKRAFEDVWAEGTLVAMPVTCYPAPRIGTTVRNMRVIECTVPGNIADAAALAVPFGKFADGMPRALQLMGPPGSEEHLIELAQRLKQ
jgi:Asp-tRNA(Asn)/Glu-tRNA(Gln) amidotransferase A subunit family amidase